MAPPRAHRYVLEQLAAFDDEALATFLAPGEDGVDPARLGTALQGEDVAVLAARIARVLPDEARHTFDLTRNDPAEPELVALRRRQVVDKLFWALLYWHDPQAYEELVAGEQIHPGVLQTLDLDGRVVADLGAGAGRFTLHAARHAARVIAVDAVPPLLERLQRKARDLELSNVETRRGSFTHLPLDDDSVDVAVACSSLTSHAPWGGDCALQEVERVVRPGGDAVVIWPDDPEWFCARGFRYMALPGAAEMHFRDVGSAARICADFYSDEAAQWVRDNHARVVPFAVLGVSPPSDACFKRVGAATPSR
ncbi:MAG TPA: methyltransferase domain-containing protein [Candidatus Angelobacter sp.]|jgi:ubiquinone/menaquinone biosynthesis C-methylase UbiE|nr:methyltransferase domain-containing protein [Candidatus Angelobacter sp.]